MELPGLDMRTMCWKTFVMVADMLPSQSGAMVEAAAGLPRYCDPERYIGALQLARGKAVNRRYERIMRWYRGVALDWGRI